MTLLLGPQDVVLPTGLAPWHTRRRRRV